MRDAGLAILIGVFAPFAIVPLLIWLDTRARNKENDHDQ